MRVVAIDPGGSNGVAIHDEKGYMTLTLTEPLELWKLLIAMKPDVAVYEDFLTNHRISQDGLHTVRVIGGILALCDLYGWQRVKHIPSHRKAFLRAAENTLKEVEKPKNVGTTKHEIDALAHLLAYEHRQVLNEARKHMR